MSDANIQPDKPIQDDAAFGIIPIFIPETATIEDVAAFKYLVIQHHAGHWGFPKGHAKPNETPQEAARRELTEETGIQAADFDLLPGPAIQERYRIEKRQRIIDKTVTYFPARVWTQAVTVQPDEIQAHAWGNDRETFDRLTYAPIKQVLRDLQMMAIERRLEIPRDRGTSTIAKATPPHP